MASGWFRRRSRPNTWAEPAQAALTAAFLDMDSRQSITEAGVGACDELYPTKKMGTKWEPVRAQCYEASGRYLNLSQQLTASAQASSRDPATQAQVAPVANQLAAAAQAVDRFYQANQETLAQASAVLATIPQLAAQAQEKAASAQAQSAQSEFAHYPSVRQAGAALAEAADSLAAAAGRPAALRDAARRTEATAKALVNALSAAPGQDQAAAAAISSVSTRLSAARTRAEKAGSAFSTLLREFNAASSADLSGNVQTGEELIGQAASELARAHEAISVHNPELALESTALARTKLTSAETAVDAVTNRLTLLRQVQATPAEHEKAVRFRLRDAQMLAVGRGLTKEWGSVLDAQVERIDRIAATLTGRHPDYWAYVTELNDVTRFIAGAVEKIRNDRKR